MTLIKELPRMERPREKMKLMGAGRLSNTELLAILLGTGTRKLSATALASRILSMEKDGIAYLAECAPEELSKIQGIGEAKSCQVIAAVELGKRIATKPGSGRINISSPQEIAALFMEDMRYLKKECFKILLLNVKKEIMLIEEISMGNINSSIVDPREVFRPAVKRGAASVALVHNHPSGNPEPSKADISVTKRLRNAGELLGVQVIDHLIIGDGSFISLRQRGVI
ncbi:MAG: DNA repair protein RadC [Clostridiales Family XIII bacterium]|nr:DNA repair protein RadC [Clostridiales Family XIII bacterium]